MAPVTGAITFFGVKFQLRAKMITAQEAREISGPHVDQIIESVCLSIRRVAEEKKRILITGRDHKDDTEFWTREGFLGSDKYKEAVKILTDLGFKVDFVYREERHFVDMYTKIEW